MPNNSRSRKATANVPPTKEVRKQAAKRREAKRDGTDPAKVGLEPFIETFCLEYARTGLLDESYRQAEIHHRQELDLTGYLVEVEETELKVKGATQKSRVLHIFDKTGAKIHEADIRRARAAHLLFLPEVKNRLTEIRREAAERIDVTAKSLAEKCNLVFGHAIAQGQLQVAANLIATEAKLFGIEAGDGAGGPSTAPATAVEIRIRDFTGKPKGDQDH